MPDSLLAELDRDGRLTIQLIDLMQVFRVANYQPAGVTRSEWVINVISENASQLSRTNDAGEATFENLKEGWVSITLTDEDDEVHAAIPAYVVQTEQQRPEPLKVPYVSVSKQIVMRNVRGYLDPQASPQVAFAPPEDYPTIQRVFYQVRLRADGNLAGRVIAPLRADRAGWGDPSRMNVTILQAGRELSRMTTDEQGRFSSPNIEPGIYGIIAAGNLGYTAFAFEVLPAASTGRQVSFQAAAPTVADELFVLLVPPPLLQQTVQSIDDQYESSSEVANSSPASSPTGGTGSGGSSGGAGGGGTGDPGLGSALGALGAIGAIGNGSGGGGDVASPANP